MLRVIVAIMLAFSLACLLLGATLDPSFGGAMTIRAAVWLACALNLFLYVAVVAYPVGER